ncbi:MAG: metallophosphoesterase [Treponema sp.]|jgi:hypothetical protein|nr:metallophosphoesterase [Treponema sp.]
MKAVIGDIHGRDFWKKVLENKEFTDIYCVGDYWDSYDVPYEVQKINFIELIQAAWNNSRLHLCLGNHDLHYIAYGEEYSGYQWRYHNTIKERILTALPLLRVAYAVDGWVISHAGFSKTFMRETGCVTIEDVQKRFDQNFGFLGFNKICADPYGDDPRQGPLWIRPKSLISDMYFKQQIVGHTPIEEISIAEENENTLIMTNTDDEGQVFVFENFKGATQKM